MKTLQPIPQCVECLLSLAKRVTVFAVAEDSRIVPKAEQIARKILQDTKNNRLSSPQLANRILREIQQLTGVADPYRQFKAQEMAQAKEIFTQLKEDARLNLRSRVSLAILGNSLDFFKNPKEAQVCIPEKFRQEDRYRHRRNRN